MERVLKFLKDIKKNNNRDWFEKNKQRYLDVKDFFEGFVGKTLDEVIKFDKSMASLEPKKMTFRIYRDVRFSKDKRPYKTNMGASFSAAGKGMGIPGYYLHIEPGNKSFIAAGLFMPEPEKLAKVRQEIDYNSDRLTKIMKDKKFRKYYSDFWDGDALKTAPKGYAKDHPHLKWLKLKSFIVEHNFTDKQVLDKKFYKTFADAAKASKPLDDFLREAIE
jgi:uncharacterized protein (TIGR02453 family)